MKSTSKTMTTLSELQRSDLNTPKNVSRRVLNEQKQNIVEYHPEELDEFRPLKPEEADECELAAFLNDHDISFLFETSSIKNNPSSVSKHRIPMDGADLTPVYLSKGSKRVRLSH
jgi:hypothetical protein